MRAGASFEAVQFSAGPGVGFSTTTCQSTEREHSGLRMRKVMGELLISIRPQEVLCLGRIRSTFEMNNIREVE
jgi:hypothetical protein